MPLESGHMLSHYRLVEEIGAGGMGVVWRAEDTTLDRAVAVKVLPEGLAGDRERLQRFEREAKLLASLNHPNIAAVYGLQEAAGHRFLAMELVPGEDLARRLQRGPLPVEDAIGIAAQIAAALEAAHRHGVIHRDLKPANVVLTPEGGVKVLDFGLAKSLGGEEPGQDPSLSPTLTSAGTQAGTILGTAAYMSPEQAKGSPLDRRTDIWSFGVTLLEMLTGRSPFQRGTVSETLAELLKGTPDWGTLPEDTTPSLRRLLERCLEKDPAWRLADMGDARIELRSAAAEEPGTDAAAGPAAAPRRSRALTWILAALALAASATAAWLGLRPGGAPVPTRLEIGLPHGQRVDSRPAISPDGRIVAYLALGTGSTRLHVRDLAEFEPRALAEAAGMGGPFFSPDGRFVGYFSGGSIWKVPVEGGTPTRLVDTPQMFGGTWAADGSIVWAPGLNAGLYRLPPGSDTPEQLTRPDSGAAGYAHILPQALPDGRVLYTVWGETQENNLLLDLETGESTPVRGSRLTEQSVASYAPGHLLVGDKQTGLLLAPLDLRAAAVTGPARNVESGVFWEEGIFLSWAAVSAEGTLVYAPGDPDRKQLVWLDRKGQTTAALEAEQSYRFPDLSPDGRRVVVTAGPDVVVVDLERGTQTRLTSLKGNHLSFRPLWMPDGKRVVFATNASGRWDLYVRNADATGEIRPLVEWEPTAYPASIARDGTLLVTSPHPETSMDLWTVRPGGEPEPYLVTPFDERSARFSPDGELVAYSSNASGRFEVYVQPAAPGGERQVVSTAGGVSPAWSPDGARLYYASDGVLWEVSVTRSPSLRFGRPARLFATDVEAGNWNRFTVGSGEDGDRFLTVLPLPGSYPDRLRVVTGWGREVGLASR